MAPDNGAKAESLRRGRKGQGGRKDPHLGCVARAAGAVQCDPGWQQGERRPAHGPDAETNSGPRRPVGAGAVPFAFAGGS